MLDAFGVGNGFGWGALGDFFSFLRALLKLKLTNRKEALENRFALVNQIQCNFDANLLIFANF